MTKVINLSVSQEFEQDYEQLKKIANEEGVSLAHKVGELVRDRVEQWKTTEAGIKEQERLLALWDSWGAKSALLPSIL